MTEKTDLRILKTYHALIDAFEKMLEEQNYDDITVNSLCDFASIRRATFYKHFSDKLEFTDFAASCLHENISKTCHAKADLHTYLSLYAASFFEYFKSHEAMVAHLLGSKDLFTLMQSLENRICLGIREKLIASGEKLPAAPEITAMFYAGGLIQTVYTWLTAKRRVPEDKMLAEITALIESVHAEA